MNINIKKFGDIPKELLEKTDKNKVRSIITLLRKAKGQYLNSFQISDECGYKYVKTCPSTRKDIKLLISLGYPIISSSKGYKLAENIEEINEYIERLNIRIYGIKNRIKMLELTKKEIF